MRGGLGRRAGWCCCSAPRCWPRRWWCDGAAGRCMWRWQRRAARLADRTGANHLPVRAVRGDPGRVAAAARAAGPHWSAGRWTPTALGRPFALVEIPATRQWAVVLRVIPEGGALVDAETGTSGWPPGVTCWPPPARSAAARTWSAATVETLPDAGAMLAAHVQRPAQRPARRTFAPQVLTPRRPSCPAGCPPRSAMSPITFTERSWALSTPPAARTAGRGGDRGVRPDAARPQRATGPGRRLHRGAAGRLGAVPADAGGLRPRRRCAQRPAGRRRQPAGSRGRTAGRAPPMTMRRVYLHDSGASVVFEATRMVRGTFPTRSWRPWPARCRRPPQTGHPALPAGAGRPGRRGGRPRRQDGDQPGRAAQRPGARPRRGRAGRRPAGRRRGGRRRRRRRPVPDRHGHRQRRSRRGRHEAAAAVKRASTNTFRLTRVDGGHAAAFAIGLGVGLSPWQSGDRAVQPAGSPVTRRSRQARPAAARGRCRRPAARRSRAAATRLRRGRRRPAGVPADPAVLARHHPARVRAVPLVGTRRAAAGRHPDRAAPTLRRDGVLRPHRLVPGRADRQPLRADHGQTRPGQVHPGRQTLPWAWSPRATCCSSRGHQTRLHPTRPPAGCEIRTVAPRRLGAEPVRPGRHGRRRARIGGTAGEDLFGEAIARAVTLIAALIELCRQGPVADYEQSVIGAALRHLYEQAGAVPVIADLLHLIRQTAPAAVGRTGTGLHPLGDRMTSTPPGGQAEFERLTQPLLRSLRALIGGKYGDVFSRPPTRPLDTGGSSTPRRSRPATRTSSPPC